MKKAKKFIALLGMVIMMALLPIGSIAAHAAEPETAVSWRFYESKVLKEEVTDISVSRDGESICFATEDGEEYVVERLTDEQYEQVRENIKHVNNLDSIMRKNSENNRVINYKRDLIVGVLSAIIIFLVFRAASHDYEKSAIYPTIDLVCASAVLVVLALVVEGIIPI